MANRGENDTAAYWQAVAQHEKEQGRTAPNDFSDSAVGKFFSGLTGGKKKVDESIKYLSMNPSSTNMFAEAKKLKGDQYKLDKKGLEQLRRPARTWADRKSGVDCDCMSIFASSILTNLQIPHKFRITKYSQDSWQHVYVIGGENIHGVLSDVEKYDPVTDTWEAVAPMKIRRVGHGAAVVNGCIYVFGGNFWGDFLTSCEKYDPVTDTWTSIADMPGGELASMVCVSLAGHVYLAGGYDGEYAFSRFERYDLATSTWETLPDMPTARSDLAGAAVGGCVYVVGGNGVGQKVVEKYDVVTRKWSRCANLTQGRMRHACVSV